MAEFQEVKFIIVRYTDALSSRPLQVWTFAEDEKDEALKFYDKAQTQWSDCYFTEVKISDWHKRNKIKYD